ncbi:methylated-DNA--[protein]-cysteine S-methyltransferase [Ornithinimicrobium cavernae]|uniref:methylated-DNA--[protein]-cysteine S-methyltransferase n=1 Tax=Ornithinimicrobium cavernae TaxID=2666047 RepID=UPI001F02A8A0|nr:methylated-DNA--[protein]-cysteine S-methyltransferase [Ornithinimicrobium cavernae]
MQTDRRTHAPGTMADGAQDPDAPVPGTPWRTPAGPSSHHVVVDSPIEELTLVCDGAALTGVYMAVHRHTDRTGWGERVRLEDASTPAVLRDAATQLSAYFAGELTDFDLPLAPRGTQFQHLVWAELLTIPFAETRSYGELATRLGNPGASRAVGLANGRNPISIVVPCHRVVGSTGQLTGYGGGIDRKRTLLALEERVGGRSLW